jgi:hypothetical protein
MEIEELILSIKDFDFDCVIKSQSKEYLTNGFKFVSYQDKDDDRKFVTNGLKRFVNKNDKIIFLLESINFLNGKLIEVDKRIDFSMTKPSSIYDYEFFQNNEDLKNKKNKYQAQIYYAVRELEKLGLNGLDKNAFSNNQVNELTRKINSLLIKIDELTVGQEIIYNFIDELKLNLFEMKSDFPLGKKRWYQRFSGIVASYIGHKGADTLYDLIKPEIMQIIKEIPIDKFLH